MSNQECKTRLQVINVNSNNPISYPFSFKASKYSGNCNNVNDPYANICVPYIIKNILQLMKQGIENGVKR